MLFDEEGVALKLEGGSKFSVVEVEAESKALGGSQIGKMVGVH